MIEISEMRQFYKTPGKDTLKVKATHFWILTSIVYFLSNVDLYLKLLHAVVQSLFIR